MSDEQLLAELREALNTAEQVPDGFVATGKAAFAWRTVDAELAALAQEATDADALAGVRAERAAVRALSFLASDVSIELEVTPDALLGQLVPARPGTIEVQAQDGTRQTVTVDESGWFAIRPLPGAMFRLHLQTANDNVITEWVRL
ncbi:MAG TPA: hypothetical protein VFZ72_08675 [Jiangellaceae bacterium]